MIRMPLTLSTCMTSTRTIIATTTIATMTTTALSVVAQMASTSRREFTLIHPQWAMHTSQPQWAKCEVLGQTTSRDPRMESAISHSRFRFSSAADRLHANRQHTATALVDWQESPRPHLVYLGGFSTLSFSFPAVWSCCSQRSCTLRVYEVCLSLHGVFAFAGHSQLHGA